MTSFLIKDARIFTGDEIFETGYVLVKNGLIDYVGPDAPPALDQSIPIISAPGHTLLPGLIDSHIHGNKGDPLSLEQSIRFGVTTVCDMHNEPQYVASLLKLARENNKVADFKTSSLAATVENGWPSQVILAHDCSEETLTRLSAWPKLQHVSDALPYVQTRLAEGASYIKLMQESGHSLSSPKKPFPLPTPSLQAALVSAAHDSNVLAVAHIHSHADALIVIDAGVDGTTHTILDQAPTKELINAYKEKGAFCIPTLAAIGSITGEGAALAQKFANDERAVKRLSQSQREGMHKCMNSAAPTSKVEYAYESVRLLKAAGVDIICGSDATPPAVGTAWGLSLHHELHLLVHEAGFSPTEALKSATSVTARRFKFTDRGILEKGRRADLLLVEGDPTTENGKGVDALLDGVGVWRGGVEVVGKGWGKGRSV